MDLECISCFISQAIRASRMVTRDRGVIEKVVREVIRCLLNVEWNIPPMLLAPQLYGIVRRITGSHDPYYEVKKLSNKVMLALYSEIRRAVEESNDPLLSALKVAAVGNMIDFGALSYNVNTSNIKYIIHNVLTRDFTMNDYKVFREKLMRARKLLYFFDNAGEIVLDKLLIETILQIRRLNKIIFVVKGGPLINDATIDDLREVGLDRIECAEVKTISNGDPGTGYPMDSLEILKWIRESDIVVAKGQGNYELFSSVRGVFFLLIVKCPVIARYLNANVGDIVLKYNY